MTDLPFISNELEKIFDKPFSNLQATPCGGGCINRTYILKESGNPIFFLKENSTSYEGMFEAEYSGLQAMQTVSGPRVPKPVTILTKNNHQYLIMELIHEGVRKSGFWPKFGRELALFHQEHRAAQFGYPMTNYIGATHQINTNENSWPEFFSQHRLMFQLDLAISKNRASKKLIDGVQRLCRKMGNYLPDTQNASLLHGDLWGGNFMTDEKGNAVLIDPAVYYGVPEADLAMTELFGGFHRDFYDAYQEIQSLDPEYPQQKKIYNLYHILNHLNLFGTSYASQAERIVRSF